MNSQHKPIFLSKLLSTTELKYPMIWPWSKCLEKYREHIHSVLHIRLLIGDKPGIHYGSETSLGRDNHISWILKVKSWIRLAGQDLRAWKFLLPEPSSQSRCSRAHPTTTDPFLSMGKCQGLPRHSLCTGALKAEE